MKSSAEELMEFCHKHEFGKIGEDLFYALAFNDLRKFECYIFRDTRGGEYVRRLTGIALEIDHVEIQIRGDRPGVCVAKLNTIRDCIEKNIKGYTSEDGIRYESAFALAPPRMITYNNEDKYMYTIVMRVMRKHT